MAPNTSPNPHPVLQHLFQTVKDKIIFKPQDPNSPSNTRKRTVGYIKGSPCGLFYRIPLEGPPFIKAVCAGDRGVVEELIRRKTDVNIRTSNGVSALMAACMERDHETIQRIFGDGISTKQATQRLSLLRDGEFRDYVQSNSEPNAASLVKLLLDAGADVNVVDNFGRAAAHYAAMGCGPAMLEVLVGAGANISLINSPDGIGPQIHQVAAEHGKSGYGTSVLWIAVERGSADVVEFLLKHGCPVDEPHFMNRTRLHFLAKTCWSTCDSKEMGLYHDCSHIKKAQVFMQNGADIDAVDDLGFIPRNYSPPMFKILSQRNSESIPVSIFSSRNLGSPSTLKYTQTNGGQ